MRLYYENVLEYFRAFEFHHKYFPAGHTIESLWQWFRMSKNQTEAYAWKIDYKYVLTFRNKIGQVKIIDVKCC